MTSRERVKKAVRFGRPDRVPREYWILPWARERYAREIAAMQTDFPCDFESVEPEWKQLAHMKGDMYKRGECVDAWGCKYLILADGAEGEVKEPLVREWKDLARMRPPYEQCERAFDRIDERCAATDRFTIAGGGHVFERMQRIRTTEQLLVDLMEQPKGLLKLREMVHEYNMHCFEKLLNTAVDGIVVGDDWGSQQALLVPPRLWRDFFKPCYREYAQVTHAAGKLFFLHSDGNILEILEDLIEIGVDAINSQLFCMNIEEIGRRFKGRICFWGEIDRQHVLTSAHVSDVADAVQRVVNALYDPVGGVIALCEFGLGARPENVREMYAAWERLTSGDDGCGLDN